MAIVRKGTRNVAALKRPQVLVQIVPPTVTELNGVPTNKIGIVGTAAFGPKDKPVTIGDAASYERTFGKVQNRKYDAGTILATATPQGAGNFSIVRRTDGTDTAATSVSTANVGNVAANAITFTAFHTGSGGNDIEYSFNVGSKANSIQTTVRIAGLVQESYDNLPDDSTFWATLANAINLGDANYARSAAPSALVTAVAGAANAAPTADGVFVSLSGGTDGADGVNATVLLGSDGATRTGAYALRKQDVSLGIIADADDPATWSAQAALGVEEGIYFVVTGPKGQTIANAIAAKHSAGVDDYSVKVMLGDWLDFSDRVNGVTRKVSPQGFVAGVLSNLSPEQASLNKRLYQIIGSQKAGLVGSGSTLSYSDAELDELFTAGIDVIANPAPGGQNFWSVQFGKNSSSETNIDGDNYTRMTNFVAATLNHGMGPIIGKPINDDLFDSVTTTLEHFLSQLLTAGLLARQDGKLPYSVKCDASINPPERTANGYLQAEVKVRYQAITRYFLINLEGGQTVAIDVNEQSAFN